MTIPYEAAVEALTKPGGMFEVTEADVRGVRMRVFESTPPSLRALFALARARGQEFLVYEDERWTFADVMAERRRARARCSSTATASRRATASRSACATTRSGSSRSPRSPRSAPSPCRSTPGGRADELAYGLEDSGATRADRRPRARRARRRRDASGSASARSAVRTGASRCPPASTALEDVVEPGAPMPDVDDRPRRRRHHPLHVGHHRRSRRAPSRRTARCSARSWRFACRAAVHGDAQPPRTRRADPYPTVLHPHRAALPRHRAACR